jgi:hypothetical protein
VAATTTTFWDHAQSIAAWREAEYPGFENDIRITSAPCCTAYTTPEITSLSRPRPWSSRTVTGITLTPA